MNLQALLFNRSYFHENSSKYGSFFSSSYTSLISLYIYNYKLLLAAIKLKSLGTFVLLSAVYCLIEKKSAIYYSHSFVTFGALCNRKREKNSHLLLTCICDFRKIPRNFFLSQVTHKACLLIST